MKTLLIALALAALPNLAMANVKTISQLTLDLDRDGKPDQVSIVEKARRNDPETFSRILKVKLSSRKHAYSYMDILMDVTSRDPEKYCARGIAELPSSVTVKLEAQKNAFVLSQVFDSGCSLRTQKKFTISLREGKLMMDKMDQANESGMMCDDQIRYAFSVDFLRREGREAYESPMEGQVSDDQWTLPQGCSLGLTEMMKTTLADEWADGRPACAKNPNR